MQPYFKSYAQYCSNYPYVSGALLGARAEPRVAFGALRTAVSGRRVSPPLFESMEILGKASTLARLARLRTHLA